MKNIRPEKKLHRTPNILIADDDSNLTDSLITIFADRDWNIITANTGIDAIEYLEQKKIDLILLDIVMPESNGYEIMHYIKQKTPDTSIIIITGYASIDSAIDCLRYGADDYLKKPINYDELLVRIEHVLAKKELENEYRIVNNRLRISEDRYQYLVENSPDIIYTLSPEGRFSFVSESVIQKLGYRSGQLLGKHFSVIIHPDDQAKARFLFYERRGAHRDSSCTELRLKSNPLTRGSLDKFISVDVKAKGIYDHTNQNGSGVFLGTYGVAQDITARKRSAEKLKNTLQKLRKSMGEIINVMVSTVEARDPYTAGHQQRVAELARCIAQEMGLSKEQVDGIRIAGSIHDLGKIKIPAEILSNPGQISALEFDLIKTHPTVAYSILKEIDFSWPVAEIVYQHHEKLDGSGYPLGLNGKAICLEAKILSVADVVEAIASHRPYRPALGIKKAIAEIATKRGIWYYPEAVDACELIFNQNKFQL